MVRIPAERPLDAESRCEAYPRPLLERSQWQCLNGPWQFAFDREGKWALPTQVQFDRSIVVPFAPETPASGINDTSFFRVCWYRRQITPPPLKAGERLMLHFGAVDFATTVWINGAKAVRHEGGYTPFSADITDLLVEGPEQTVVVRAEDDPFDLAKPRGKQDWQLDPHSIWYPRTSGIWQTVWLEVVPENHLTHLRWTPSVERWEISVETRVAGPRREDLVLYVRLRIGSSLLAEDSYAVIAGEVHRRIALSDPGIDDYRNDILWRPASPRIIDADLELRDRNGNVLDRVSSYTALRSIGVQGDRFVLNGRPYPLRLVLDQGYWPQSGLTAPDDESLRKDVILAKAMGFNGVRKHQKIEDPRYLYWADRLGLLVWEEMPSAYRFTKLSIDRLLREWAAVIERDLSHPCIIAWVPFNESWGVPDLPDSPAQRHYVQALYHLTKTLDPTRPVVGNDGWESVATDIIGIHDYDAQAERLRQRYGSEEKIVPHLLKRERPGGRLLVVGDRAHESQPLILSEFGGIAFSRGERTWGYSRADSTQSFALRYHQLLQVVRTMPMFAGFCYTQFADTYQEANGLLYADRTPKFDLTDMALATRGATTERDWQVELDWRERMMNLQRAQIEDHRMYEERG